MVYDNIQNTQQKQGIYPVLDHYWAKTYTYNEMYKSIAHNYYICEIRSRMLNGKYKYQ